MFYATDGAVAERNALTRRLANGTTIKRRPYFGPAPAAALESAPDAIYSDPVPGEMREPQAYLIEQDANSELGAHFHFVDQFQVFVDGDGFIGRHEVKPYTVQFAQGSTGYGPIRAGANGLKYLTMRGSSDTTGAQHLPAAKARMRNTSKRNVIVDVPGLSELNLIRGPVKVSETSYLNETDGLACVLTWIPPGESIDPAPQGPGAGRSLIVLSGTVRCRDVGYGRLAVFYISADEQSAPMEALNDGAHVLILQYPHVTKP